MQENIARKSNGQFLTVWSILNLTGWIVGLIGVFLIWPYLETNKFSAWGTFLISLPLGTSIGLFQWFNLKRLGINFFVWVLITALGFSVLAILLSWFPNHFSSLDPEYNFLDWVIQTIGFTMAILIGGAIIGSLQSIVIRKYISSQGLWIRAYIFGLLSSFAIFSIVGHFKALFLNTLYFFKLYVLAFGLFKYIILEGLVVLVASIGISLPTGNMLLKKSSRDSIPNTG